MLEVSRADLARALQLVAPLAPEKTDLPVIRWLLLQMRSDRPELGLVGTDLQQTMECRIGGTASADPGESTGDQLLLVDGRQLQQLIQQLKEPRIVLGTDRQVLTIRSGRKSYRSVGHPSGGFPRIPQPLCTFYPIDAAVFRTMIGAVAPCAPEPGYPSEGVLIHSEVTDDPTVARTVGLSVHRMAFSENRLFSNPQRVPTDRGFPRIGRQFVGTVERFLQSDSQALIGWTEERIFLSVTGPVTRILSVQQMAGTFAQYERATEIQLPHRLVLMKQDLIDALNRADLIASHGSDQGLGRSIQLHLSADELVVTTERAGVGDFRESVPVTEYNGPAQTLSFGPRYLRDLAAQAVGDEIEISVGSPTDPLVSRSETEAERHFYLIMPITGQRVSR